MSSRMNVVFPDDVMEEMRTMVPEGRRTEFVVEATRLKLLRDRQRRAIDAAAGSWAGDGGPTSIDGVRAELEELRAPDRGREATLEAIREGRR